jgi:hypothetical protein
MDTESRKNRFEEAPPERWACALLHELAHSLTESRSSFRRITAFIIFL